MSLLGTPIHLVRSGNCEAAIVTLHSGDSVTSVTIFAPGQDPEPWSLYAAHAVPNFGCGGTYGTWHLISECGLP